MKNLVTNWSIRRIIYLAMGVFFLIASLKDQFWLMTIVGLYAISMALFSFGCAAGNCTIERKIEK